MLDRQQWHHFVVPENDLTVRAEDEPDIEEAPGELRMARLGLGHQECIPLPGQAAEEIGLRARDVDRAFPGELFVVEVENLVVEPWRAPSGTAMSRTGGSRLDSHEAALIRCER